MSAHGIAHSLMAHPQRNREGYLVSCVCHDDRHPSLSLWDGNDGRLMVHCFAGCDRREILNTLREMGLLDGSLPASPPPPLRPANRSRILNDIIDGTKTIDSVGDVARYLEGRSIFLSLWPDDLREHPALEVWEGSRPTGQKFPTLVAIIRNGEGQPAGLHLTFLRPDGSGKAEIKTPRRIIGIREGSTRGATVRLYDPKDGSIGLAEGIETALSAYLLTGIPIWACLNAGGIERAELPEEIKRVVIFADKDPSGTGQQSAAKAALRFRDEGRKTEILVPDKLGHDFNDVLITRRAHQLAG